MSTISRNLNVNVYMKKHRRKEKHRKESENLHLCFRKILVTEIIYNHTKNKNKTITKNKINNNKEAKPGESGESNL